MISILRMAWRAVLKRALADWFILSATAVTIAFAAILLAAGPIYADAVTLSAARRTLTDSAVAEANLEVTTRILPENYTAANNFVNAELSRTFSLTGGTINQRVMSQSYELPDQRSEEFTELAVFEYFRDIEEHAEIVFGAWPVAASTPFEAAISEATAGVLGLSVGDELLMTSRRDRTDQPSVRVVGIYAINNTQDPFWFDDDLDVSGVTAGSSFTTFGPFVVDLETMFASLSEVGSEVNWRVLPRYSTLEISDIPELRESVQGLEARLANTQGIADGANFAFQVDTQVTRILSDTERSLLATRSSVLIISIQLAILAGYALLLTVGLLVESRRTETSLLRSRGASSEQILAMAIMEGAVLTVPAALLAPWAAARLLRIFNVAGPLRDIGLTINPATTQSAYVLAFLAAAGCVMALALPAYRSARSFGELAATHGRERTQSSFQRSGIDLALLALAGVAFWQLQRHGTQITTNVQGRLAADPIIIAAPALGLLAGAVLALRVIPLMARLAERSAAAGSAAVRALAAWQVARRPQRYARSALLLIMAITIGLLATSYSSTWTRSQEDQAEYQVGADIRVRPNRRIADSIPEMNLSDAHEQLAGLEISMPVSRQSRDLSRTAGTARLVMLDASSAASVVRIRDDLAGRGFAEMMGELVEQRPTLAGLDLPGKPRRLAIDVEVVVDPLPDGFIRPQQVPENRLRFSPSVRVVLQDADGLLHRVPLGPIPVDAGLVRMVGDLHHDLGNGQVALPIYPLAVVDIEIISPTPLSVSRRATVEIAAVLIQEREDEAPWTETDSPLDPGNWTATNTDLRAAPAQPSISFSSDQPESGLRFVIVTGTTTQTLTPPVHFGIRPEGTELPDRFPIVVSEGFLDITGTDVGDEIQLTSLQSGQAAAVIVGTVTSFPTIEPTSGEAIVIDLPTFQMITYQTGARITEVNERWLAVSDPVIEAVSDGLLGEPYETVQVTNRVGLANALKSDPVALGTVGSLSLGFIAAVVFAVVGFTVSAAVSARSRTTEFALLRAVGLSSNQLARWLSIEHGILVVISLVFGSIIGLLLAWVILPLISITQDATAAVPGVLVVLPWSTVIWLELAVVAALAVIVAILATVLRRLGLGSLLRLGED